MTHPVLLHDLIRISAARDAEAIALEAGAVALSYASLAQGTVQFANGLLALGLARADRVAVYLEKRFESVTAIFGTSAAGGVAVPINPALKPGQVEHILRDCGVRILVTSPERLRTLLPILPACGALSALIVTDEPSAEAAPAGLPLHPWHWLASAPTAAAHRAIDADMAAIFYTSGSTGKPKGVVLSHRNLVVGAQSVAGYLGNTAGDALLAALPLSFDAGFSQLTTAFCVGARVALLNYLLPQDVLRAIERHRITGLTAVPPLYIQLARLEWPAGAGASLRYFANTGGHMPRQVLAQLRQRLPAAAPYLMYGLTAVPPLYIQLARLEWPARAGASLRYFANTGGHMPRQVLAQLRQRLPAAAPYLMYGLTEAFRSTYLAPEEVDRRPDSIGRAIPNAEVLVLRPDGTPCAAQEPGELVHRGALVALGYWNDPQATAARFRPLPATALAHAVGLPLPELAVFSGDTVRADAAGFLYFVGRQDDMIKTSGYRVSPTEVEDAVYTSGLVLECAAFGIPDALIGQAIAVAVVTRAGESFNQDALLAFCRGSLPAFMLPTRVMARASALPRNPNGKIDRRALLAECAAPDGA